MTLNAAPSAVIKTSAGDTCPRLKISHQLDAKSVFLASKRFNHLGPVAPSTADTASLISNLIGKRKTYNEKI